MSSTRPTRRSLDGTASRSNVVIDDLGAAHAFARDDKIFRLNQPAKYLYKVQTGCVRTYAQVRNGGRFDLAFYYAGDYFGIEPRRKHNHTAEAVVASEVLAIPNAEIEARAAVDLAVAKEILEITNSELRRAQDLRLVLHNSAEQRVTGFLHALKRRSGKKSVELPMSRRDIADHLNLTIESVSRALTQLHNRSVISLESQRRVRLNSRH